MVRELREWEKIKLIEFELEKGQAIQREFLPRMIPDLPNWEIAACFQPAGKVSGDFYDVFMLPDGCVGLVIADVCDKGVGSALYMALFRSLIRVFSTQSKLYEPQTTGQVNQYASKTVSSTTTPSEQRLRLEAVSYTNNYIAQIHGDEGMFATMFFGVLNPATGGLSYINGGHEPLMIIGKEHIKTHLIPTGPAVGLMSDMNFKIMQIQLDPGDTLLGFTDGVTEARSPGDELFTRNRLQSIVTTPLRSAADLLDQIESDLMHFIDIAPRRDDVTMLAVQRMPT